MKHPTKARVEFEGDCYGSRFDAKAPECSICLVARKCKRRCDPQGVPAESKEPLREKPVDLISEEFTVKTEKLSKKDLKGLKPVSPKKPGKLYLKDKENCGTRENSAIWALYQIVKEVYDKGQVFSKDELAKDGIMICKKKKIKFNPEAKLPRAIPFFLKQGLIARTDKRGYYIKMVS